MAASASFSTEFIHARTSSSPSLFRRSQSQTPRGLSKKITGLNECERRFDASRDLSRTLDAIADKHNVELTTRLPMLKTGVESNELQENVQALQRAITHIIISAPPTPPTTPLKPPAVPPDFKEPKKVDKKSLSKVSSMDSINTAVTEEPDFADDASSPHLDNNTERAHSWSSISHRLQLEELSITKSDNDIESQSGRKRKKPPLTPRSKKKKQCCCCVVWFCGFMLFVVASVAMAALIKGVAEREAVAKMHSTSWCRNDTATVCATSGAWESKKWNVSTFQNPKQAFAKGQRVLHCGSCGYCSNKPDIDKILKQTTSALAQLANVCTRKALFFGFKSASADCVGQETDFSPRCSDCWVEKIMCGLHHCPITCLLFASENQQDCLKCEETYCGKQFQVCAGATRRRIAYAKPVSS